MKGSGLLADLKPLKVSCTSTQCDDDLHCFKRSRKQILSEPSRSNQGGVCRDCGADQVDWNRVYRRDLSDIDYTVSRLQQELIRNQFWNEEFSQKSKNYAIRKGRQGLRLAIRKRLFSSVGKASEYLYRDGMQTPTQNISNPIFAAQHATATCCRKCIEYWHGIPKDRDLSQVELEYLAELIDYFFDKRMPELDEQGMKVSAIRRGF